MSDQTARKLAPFSTSCSPNIPEFLTELGISLLVSTYQAGKVCVISAKDDEQLVILPRNFPSVTAVERNEDKLAIATLNSVIILRDDPRLAAAYPNQPDTYDSIYLPQAEYFTGPLAVHGLHWTDRGLLAVNTAFSCLSLIGENNSFLPVWKPWFIEELKPEDRCHLNGMVCRDGAPVFVTAFNTGSPDGGSWRGGDYENGLLIDVSSNSAVAEGLRMPHSPLLVDDRLLMLESAAGTLIDVNPADGSRKVLKQLDGFLRGMDVYEDFLFIGESKIRKNSSTFRNMEIAEKAKTAGVYIIHLPSMGMVGKITFNASVDEIYDVRVLPGRRRPNILNTEKELHRRLFSFPGSAAWLSTTGGPGGQTGAADQPAPGWPDGRS